jgi:hypothetical protein
MSSVGAMSELASANRPQPNKERKSTDRRGMSPSRAEKKKGKEGGHGIEQLRDSQQETGAGELAPRERGPSPKKVHGTPLSFVL